MTDDKTLMLLKSERARHPELAETLDLHITILEARVKVGFQISEFRFQIDETRARLEQGKPILRADELELDWNAVARLAQTICDIAAHHRPHDADAFADIARTMTPARVQELAREYLVSAQHATHSNLQSPLLAFVLNNALHPFLAAYARAGRNFVADATWYRTDCPICGGEPDFSALEKESGARRLLCSRCDFEWTFHRAVCPFCGAEKLGYYPGGEGAYRLYTCENCRRYLKTIDLRELVREVHLPVERVLTIGMDLAASQAGYG